MPRRGSPAPRRAPSRSPPPRAAARPAPRPAAPSPPPHQSRSGGLLGGGGLGSTLATGMAFGAGSEIAHQAVRGMMGSGSGHESAPAASQGAPAPAEYQEQAGAPGAAAQPQYNPCMEFNQSLLRCMKENSETIGQCQNYMSMLKQCEMDNAHLFRQTP